MRRVLLGVLAVGIAGGLTACDTDYRTASDENGCLYDSYFNKLKDQLPPGSLIREDDRDVLVTIPASNRFYNITRDKSRDPLAPRYLLASDRNQIPITVEGQARFRFAKASVCEWFSKHGRRNAENGDLKFNARGAKAEKAGWFNWLAENMALSLKQVTPSVTNQYDWAKAYFHYPINADADTGEVPDGERRGPDTVVALGNDIGERLTESLEKELGGKYFCGVTVTQPGGDDDCPPINFQVTNIQPVDGDLLTGRQDYEATRQEQENARRTNQLEEDNKAANEQAAATELKVLERRKKKAELQAETKAAECLVYAKAGLDCTPQHLPLPVQGGDSITINRGK